MLVINYPRKRVMEGLGHSASLVQFESCLAGQAAHSQADFCHLLFILPPAVKWVMIWDLLLFMCIFCYCGSSVIWLCEKIAFFFPPPSLPWEESEKDWWWTVVDAIADSATSTWDVRSDCSWRQGKFHTQLHILFCMLITLLRRQRE